VEELVYDQEPEERAFKTGKPVIAAQGCHDDGRTKTLPGQKNGRRRVVAKSQTKFVKNLERMDHAAFFY
jgi:hypothetical protein